MKREISKAVLLLVTGCIAGMMFGSCSSMNELRDLRNYHYYTEQFLNNLDTEASNVMLEQYSTDKGATQLHYAEKCRKYLPLQFGVQYILYTFLIESNN